MELFIPTVASCSLLTSTGGLWTRNGESPLYIYPCAKLSRTRGKGTTPIEHGSLHVQWLEDILLNELIEVMSAFLINDLGRQSVGPLVLEELGPKLVDGLEVGSCLRKLAPRELSPVLSQAKADLLLETCAVTQDVPYGPCAGVSKGTGARNQERDLKLYRPIVTSHPRIRDRFQRRWWTE